MVRSAIVRCVAASACTLLIVTLMCTVSVGSSAVNWMAAPPPLARFAVAAATAPRFAPAPLK